MVAIIGADGSGKSTLIHDLQQQFKHAQVRKIYVLNRACQPAPSGKQIQNYALAPRSSLLSIIKLWVRAFRWLLIYWLELLKIKKNGGLILCDHFYFSGVLLDPMKYR